MEIVSLANIIADLTMPKDSSVNQKMEYVQQLTEELKILRNNNCENLIYVLETLTI